MNMKFSSMQDLPAVRILGRHAEQNPLTLFYTASGIECCFTGSELWLCLNAGYELYEPWISVELNGACISRFAVNPGESEMCLFRGMTPGVPKRIRVLKDVQAMHDDPAHFLQITGLRYAGGGFLPLPEPAYRLEFVGDSITSGEGAIGAKTERDWISAFFSAQNHYARMTADALDAEYRIVSQSGWGLISGWDNNPRHRVMDFYEQVCGLAVGAHNTALGAALPCDFAAWPADAVILNLGTNDEAAMHQPAWQDPVTGERFCQPDTPQGRACLEDAAVRALGTLRRCNPHALLVWACGMLGDALCPVLEQAVARYRAESGDTRACFLPLPAAVPQTLGAREHPGLACHQQAAQVLTAFLRQSLAKQTEEGNRGASPAPTVRRASLSRS